MGPHSRTSEFISFWYFSNDLLNDLRQDFEILFHHLAHFFDVFNELLVFQVGLQRAVDHFQNAGIDHELDGGLAGLDQVLEGGERRAENLFSGKFRNLFYHKFDYI